MNKISNKSIEKNKISRKKIERLRIIAILLWIIFDAVGFLYLTFHINILLYILLIILVIIVVIFVYIVKNRHNVLDK